MSETNGNKAMVALAHALAAAEQQTSDGMQPTDPSLQVFIEQYHDWACCMRAAIRLLDLLGNSFPRDPRARAWAEVIADEMGVQVPEPMEVKA